MDKSRVSRFQIWNMCCGLFGIQIVWGLQNANTSWIFQTLGADVNELAILWIAAPATGLFLQPIVGRMSDRTWSRLGRRRPYLFYGSLMTAAAMLLMPNATTLLGATLALWMLCASINLAMEPFRALIADSLPHEKRTSGYAVQVFFIGSGAVLASALPWLLTNLFDLSDDAPGHMIAPAVRVSFYIGAVLLLVAVMWTVFTTREAPPESFGNDAGGAPPERRCTSGWPQQLFRGGLLWSFGGISCMAIAAIASYGREFYVLAGVLLFFGLAQLAAGGLRACGRHSLGMLEIIEDIVEMPQVLKKLAVVQFFTWFGLFAMWIYATPTVAMRHFGAADAASPLYGKGAEWVGILFAGYNGVAALAALLLPSLSVRIGQCRTHALCLALGAVGFWSFPLVEDPRLLWLPFLGIGLAWASILCIPYAVLSNAVPAQKMGVYMGIHNLFLVIPQLVAATVLGPIIEQAFGGEAVFALVLAGCALALASLSSLTIAERRLILTPKPNPSH